MLRRFLPAWYRRRFAEELLRVHVDRGGGPRKAGGPRFWGPLLWDVVATAVQTRVGGLAGPTGLGRRAKGPSNGTTGGMAMTMSEVAFETKILVRSLARKPGYAVMAVLTLGLGIGVASSIFALVYGSLLHPLPYERPGEIVQIRDLYQPTGGSGAMSVPNYVDLRDGAGSLDGFAAYTFRSVNVATEESPARLTGLGVTSDFLGVLGVAPALGRDFAEGEDRAGGPHIALVTHALWRESFGAGPAVPGETLLLDGVPTTVVGVLPEDFWFPGDPQILLPMGLDPENSGRGNRSIEGLARLAQGIPPEAAEAELRTLFARIADEFPAGNEGWTVRVLAFRDFALAGNRTAFQLLAGAALLVLLIGCVNVANLMLVRAERRQKETAVRAAMGAGRMRLARQYMGEGLLVAGAASVLGLGLTWVGCRTLVGLWGDSLPRAAEVGLSGPVVGFSLGTALLTALLVGLVPTARLDLGRMFGTLREGGFTGGGPDRGLQKALVTVEVALAVILVAGAGLLLNSAWRWSRIEPGVELDRALVFRVQVPQATYQEYADVTSYFQEAVDRLGALPAVQAVGITDRIPLRGGYNITTLASPVDETLESSFVEIRRVTPGFLEAAGIPLLQGRNLTEADGRTGAEVVLVSERVARELFPEGGAVGSRIHPGWNENGYEIVGVVGNVREFGLLRDERPALYWPYPVAGANRSMTFVVRTRGDAPLDVMPDMRAVMREIDPTIPLYGVATMHDVALQTLGSRRLATNLFASFGAMALLLAALGVFGVLAYSVEQRTREIGIRIAVGAGMRRVTRHVVVQGLRLVSLGLLLGGAAAWFGGRLLAELLYEVEPGDALTLGAVMAVVLATSVVAAWLPARRAARVEPSVALRTE